MRPAAGGIPRRARRSDPVVLAGFRTTEQPASADGATEAWIAFETKTGRGTGRLRLKDGKAWTLPTARDAPERRGLAAADDPDLRAAVALFGRTPACATTTNPASSSSRTMPERRRT